MTAVSTGYLESLRLDLDQREEQIRLVVDERLDHSPAPRLESHVVASYFLSLRDMTLDKFGAEIVYHATNGVRNADPRSLVAACAGEILGIESFDSARQIGLIHVGFPLKMLAHPDGHLTSVDVLHATASAIVFDVYEALDARLVSVQLPDEVIATFPGPAYGPAGMRRLAHRQETAAAFGTILKPTAGLTPDDIGSLVTQVATTSFFMFIKEDENLYPDLSYAPVAERTRRAIEALERTRATSGTDQIVFAPHITSAPHELASIVESVVAAGATAVMLSETFAGGAFRTVRDSTRSLPAPPAIYGHNAGIGTKTRAIWREVIDLFARLDGVDVRQTAPVLASGPFLKPYGAEWVASEQALTRELLGITPTMIARAGGLDQGNIILNLQDAEMRGLSRSVLYLAGSAINSIRGEGNRPNPALGIAAMAEALAIHNSGELRGVSPAEHLVALRATATRDGMAALVRALDQRYPGTER